MKIIAIFLSYFIGAIPTGYLIGRLLTGKNIYRHGSGNPGTANAVAVLGKTPGILVFILDIGKGLAAMVVVYLFGGRDVWLWWGGASAVIGHIYPITMKFRGGKGLATGLAVVTVLMPITIPVFILIWALAFFPTHHVPLASALGMIGVLLVLLFHGIWPGVLGAAFIIWRHWPESIEYIKGRRNAVI